MSSRQTSRCSFEQQQTIALLQSLSDSFEKIFRQAGRSFFDAKTAEEYPAIKTKANTSIKETVALWRKIHGKEEVSRALKALHLEEFDT